MESASALCASYDCGTDVALAFCRPKSKKQSPIHIYIKRFNRNSPNRLGQI